MKKDRLVAKALDWGLGEVGSVLRSDRLLCIFDQVTYARLFKTAQAPINGWGQSFKRVKLPFRQAWRSSLENLATSVTVGAAGVLSTCVKMALIEGPIVGIEFFCLPQLQVLSTWKSVCELFWKSGPASHSASVSGKMGVILFPRVLVRISSLIYCM